MQNKKYVIGNWKMNPASYKEARSAYTKIVSLIRPLRGVTVVICPPSPYLFPLSKVSRSKKVFLGAQNIFWKPRGSYTGEVAISQVKDAGATFVIIGHSERRAMGETNKQINEKVLLALSLKMTPVLCIGEQTRDKEGRYLAFLEEELRQCLLGVKSDTLSEIIIAYEPIWAIGGAEAMSGHDIYQTTILIKKIIADIYTKKVAMDIPIIYGGSVNPENIQSIIEEGNVDGVLPGRASLDPDSLSAIIKVVADKK